MCSKERCSIRRNMSDSKLEPSHGVHQLALVSPSQPHSLYLAKVNRLDLRFMCIFNNPRARSMRLSQITAWRHIPRANLQRNEPGTSGSLRGYDYRYRRLFQMCM
jgi:hypothetical protein